MTQNWLEYDWKIFTPTNLIFYTWPNFTIPTSINLTPKKMLVRSAWTGPPAPACKLVLAGHLPSLAALLYKKKKPLGTEIRRTQDVKLRFVSFRRFIGFNFGQVQLLRFVDVMVQSYSFGHLYSVMLTTLNVK